MIEKRPDNEPEEASQALIRKLEEKEQQRQRIIAINSKASAPVLAELAAAGFNLEWVTDLYSKKLNYKSVIPILLKWLPQIENLDVKEDIVRALSVPWAKSIAAPLLVTEFRKMENESNTGIKWAIANALSVVADDHVFTEIVEFVMDRRHGKAREMLALSLGNMNDPRAQDVLIGLLDDEDVVGHAIIALGKLKSVKARREIERFTTASKTWVRKEAKKALAKIDKAYK
jgi:HEAT repeat protein